jgi:hypothetical protein
MFYFTFNSTTGTAASSFSRAELQIFCTRTGCHIPKPRQVLRFGNGYKADSRASFQTALKHARFRPLHLEQHP